MINRTDKEVLSKQLEQWFEAARQGDVETLAELLRKNEGSGFDLANQLCGGNKRNALMMTLDECVKVSRCECARLLIPLTNPLHRSKQGSTALMFAIQWGGEQIINDLLPHSDLVTPDRDGWTPLMHAAYRGRLETVAKLLPDSDVLKVSSEGENAVMLAAENGKLDCVRLIASTMTDFSQRNKDGFSADNIASNQGYADISLFLRGVIQVQTEKISLQKALAKNSYSNGDQATLFKRRL